MRNRTVRALVVTSIAILVSIIGLGGPARANEALSGVTTAKAAAGTYTCYVTPQPGRGTIIVRDEPRTGSGIATYLQQGEYLESSCSRVSGYSYTACGGTSSEWVYLNLGLFWRGYVASRCVEIVRVND